MLLPSTSICTLTLRVIAARRARTSRLLKIHDRIVSQDLVLRHDVEVVLIAKLIVSAAVPRFHHVSNVYSLLRLRAHTGSFPQDADQTNKCKPFSYM